ncbi:hypothetical protein SAY86_016413 [Trapa natans]|uniref:Uncharacterized protein n=1 Tax=Trapa natans TaxID=22666 RepID=A0AAN7QZF7_TRANT|nr:hypothetical protein SAY86_016413 [Trapa natans]
MGSLMAGWDSPVQDPKDVELQRNRSFTKEEIEAYWRSKKKAEDELASSPADDTHTQEGSMAEDARRSNFMELRADAWENLIKNNDWWTRSKWAFLNQPPLSGGITNSYTSQFHVANIHRSKMSHAVVSNP